ncbi:putative quinol monooxygenase [Streptacidiphilus monticola]
MDTVVAYFDHIAPEYRAEFQAAAQKEAYLALRTEPGTLGYHIVPDPADPSRFIFEATFRNAAAYAYHRGHYPAQDFLKLVARDGISGPHIVVDNTSVPNELG